MQSMLYAGANVTLECSAVGDPPPQVTWHKSGGTIPPNRTELLSGGLHLSHVRKGDEGVYICDMSNGVGQPVRHLVMLHIQGKQKFSVSHFTHLFCFLLSSHNVCCLSFSISVLLICLFTSLWFPMAWLDFISLYEAAVSMLSFLIC
jgi:hypothetical protein